MSLGEKLQVWTELLLNTASKYKERLASLLSFKAVGVGLVGAMATIGVAAAVITAGGLSGHRGSHVENGGAAASFPIVESIGHGTDASGPFVRPGSQSFAVSSGGSGGTTGVVGAFMPDSEATNSGANSSSPIGSYAYGDLPPEFAAPVSTNAAAGDPISGAGSSSISNSSICCSVPATTLAQGSGAALLSLNGSGNATLSLNSSGATLVFSSPHVPVVPEPSVVWLGSLGLVVVAARVRKLKKSAANNKANSSSAFGSLHC